jgi:hypothetical protein
MTPSDGRLQPLEENNNMKFCNECKKGGTYGVPAHFKATGTLLRDKWGKVKRIPWKAHLCDGHVDVICTDGFVGDDPVENFKTFKI